MGRWHKLSIVSACRQSHKSSATSSTDTEPVVAPQSTSHKRERAAPRSQIRCRFVRKSSAPLSEARKSDAKHQKRRRFDSDSSESEDERRDAHVKAAHAPAASDVDSDVRIAREMEEEENIIDSSDCASYASDSSYDVVLAVDATSMHASTVAPQPPPASSACVDASKSAQQ